MKTGYLFLALSILFGCKQSLEMTLQKSKFTVEKFDKYDCDNIELTQLNKVEDKELIEKLLSPLYKEEELDSKVNNNFFYFHWLDNNDGIEKFTLLTTDEEYSTCAYELYLFTTGNEGLIDAKRVEHNSCVDICPTDYSDFKLINDSIFIITGYYLPWQELSSKAEKYIESCKIDNYGKFKCNKQNLVPAVVLWDKLSVRKSPKDDGEYITTIKLGEEIDSFQEYITDENSSRKNKYVKVMLSDGSEGWVLERFIMEKAEPVTATKTTKIYDRPDPIASTNDNFEIFDILGVSERLIEDDVWLKVKGLPKGGTLIKEGWIKEEDVAWSTSFIAISSAVRSKEKTKARELLKEPARSSHDFDFIREAKRELDIGKNKVISNKEELKEYMEPFFGKYELIKYEDGIFKRFHNTCEYESYNLNAEEVWFDMVQDGQGYQLISIRSEEYGDEIILSLKDENNEVSEISLITNSEYLYLQKASLWDDSFFYFVIDYQLQYLPEDKEECYYGP